MKADILSKTLQKHDQHLKTHGKDMISIKARDKVVKLGRPI